MYIDASDGVKMLDDPIQIKLKDPSSALAVAASEFEQVIFPAEVLNPEHDRREIKSVVVLGMGGSALAALVLKSWLRNNLKIPVEVCRNYDLPGYVSSSTLVIASSYSGNTEETLSGLEQAQEVGSILGIIAAGGKLVEIANENNIAHVKLPDSLQPRMAVTLNLRALTALLVNFGVLSPEVLEEIASTKEWLAAESNKWNSDVATADNLAKQIALAAVGKTPIFYGGNLTGPAAYRFKISWNENAKNVAFYNELPEMNHNEFMGWTSHPVEKPFAVFDIVSSFENPRTIKRFSVTDRLLSGLRPKSLRIELAGDTILKQLLWAGILADYASIYTAILNGVDPTPVALIEKLKQELK
jgi:glucose/mannose-6-phosphate isomerase